ncbi:MAG TPA: hypothetical protein VFB12_28075 [Ktedonobacteraceae bacterium]|nr:hypothetical protein [Ktedonobacteraceae bacterium]
MLEDYYIPPDAPECKHDVCGYCVACHVLGCFLYEPLCESAKEELREAGKLLTVLVREGRTRSATGLVGVSGNACPPISSRGGRGWFLVGGLVRAGRGLPPPGCPDGVQGRSPSLDSYKNKSHKY